MRNKKLISMLLLPAAFVACTDDFNEGNSFPGNNSEKEVVEDLVLGVSFDTDNLSRAAYAGDSLGNPYQNFYLEPEFDGNNIALSDNFELKGDMLGYCLSNGANAITNLPFYIAGYGTAKDSVIYTFADQATGNALYYLGLDKKQTAATFTKDLFDASVDSIAKKPANKALGIDELDVRKGIVRTNAGIMTGNYVAYFPYNKAWTEPSGIPAVAMDALYDVDALSATRAEALAAVDFYDYLFAVSQQANEVKGGVKAGNVSLKPLTSALTFKLTNTYKPNKAGDKLKLDTIKRITIRTIEETAGFTLEGKVALNNLGAITASKATDLIGVSFPEVDVDTATVKFVTIPFYPNPTVTGYVIEVYNTKGQVATIEKATAKFELGTGYLTTIDTKDLTFANTTRKIFSEKDFIEEAVAGGDLMLMTDITIDDPISNPFAKDLNIKGAKKLTLTTGSYTGKLTMAEGSHLVLNGASVKAIAADTMSINANTVFDSTKNIAANTLNINATGYNKLFNATINVLNNNNGNLWTKPNKAEGSVAATAVTISTLNNKANVEFDGTGVNTVGTLNNLGRAAADGYTSGSLVKISTSAVITTINNAAAVEDNTTTKDKDETVYAGIIYMWYDDAVINAATVNNAGEFYWQSNKPMNLVVENTGSFMFGVNTTCDFTGTLNNSGKVLIAGSVEGKAGSINNSTNGVIDILADAYIGFTTTKLNINAGKVIVNGSVNGNSNITVAEGAEFIATAANENVLLSTLGTSFINAKYTGIKVTSPTWPATVLSTSKKIYLNGNISFTKATALNGGLVIENDAKVTATGLELTTTSIEINAGKTLEVAAKTNVTVSGTITNNGTYKQAADAVVWCNGIVTGTDATWVNKPNY